MKLASLQWDRNSPEAPLKQLARIVEQKQFKDRPTIPLHARKQPIYRENTANELTNSIIAFFNFQNGFAERINNMGQQLNQKGEWIWVKGNGKDGTADISATLAGMSIKVEVKAGNDRQSDAQKAYQDRVKQAGGIYIIARSFEGFLFEFFRAMEGRLS